MVLDNHRFLCFKGGMMFFLEQQRPIMCHFPTVPAHLLLLILLNFSKCENTHMDYLFSTYAKFSEKLAFLSP